MTSKHRRGLLVAVALILLLVCAVAAGTYWAVGPVPQCARPAEGPAQSGWSARTLVSGDLERCYYLYVPPGYDLARPVPVVLSFHGFLSNSNSHALITGWHKLAEREGFLVVYPQGTKFPQRWDAGATWGNSDVADVQFFGDMLDDLSAVAAVDRSRIYVNGFSNGGGMAVRIGCEVADRVAAIGSVAGAVVAGGWTGSSWMWCVLFSRSCIKSTGGWRPLASTMSLSRDGPCWWRIIRASCHGTA